MRQQVMLRVMFVYMARRVGSCLCVVEDKLYRWRGDVTVYRPQWIDQLEELNLSTGRWSRYDVRSRDPDGGIPPAFTAPACVAMNGRMYLFGGFGSVVFGFPKTYYRDVYELDLDSFTWQHLRAFNEREGPIEKYLCGMIPYEDEMLLIFGGFGVKANGIPLQKGAEYQMNEDLNGMWTNEMHLFHVTKRLWVVPHTSGERPPPCAAFSFTKIDLHRVVLFAGRHRNHMSNEIYILDMATWHWTGPISQSRHGEPWPTGRSLHTAACLCDPKYVLPSTDERGLASMQPNWLWPHLCTTHAEEPEPFLAVKEQHILMLWGQDSNGDQITEAWILHTNSMAWQQLSIPEKRMKGRKWHSTVAYYPSPFEATVLTLGGYEKDRTNWVICLDYTDTLVLYFGVPPLYKLCFKAVCSLPNDCLTMYLPKHILADLSEWREMQKNIKLCQCLRL